MRLIFRKGDLVQSIRGGPVMRVVSIAEDSDGETVVNTVLLHEGMDRPGRFFASRLKIVGVPRGWG